MDVVASAEKTFRVGWLTLDNYRGFAHLDFLPSMFNVIVGINGSGKTTLLEGMANALYGFTERVVNGWDEEDRIASSDIKTGQSFTLRSVGVLKSGQRYVAELTRTAAFDARVEPTYRDTPRSTLGIEREKDATLGELGLIYRHHLKQDDGFSLPTLAYYPVGRVVLDIPPLNEDRFAFGQAFAYEGAFETRRDFRAFFDWFRLRQDAENDWRIDDPEHRDVQLEAVRKAVSILMENHRDLRVRHAPLRMTLKKGDEELTTDQLSGGEKALLALVGDLARRMAIANPGLPNPLHGEGVVMIDEVDLHLHPSWQRKVVQRLPETFPNVQFFLTTHSPVVASAVRPESLWVLRDGEIRHAEAYGQDVGLVLSEVFDTPPRLEEVRHDLDALFEAIHRQDVPDAERRLKALEDTIGPSDPELVQARVMMQGYTLA